MTLALMQGFETCRDVSDVTLQNGMVPILPAFRPGFGPSLSGLAGTSLRPIGAGLSQVYSGAQYGGAADRTLGYLNTGVTVNQAWTAGGITLGWGARYNSGVANSYGAGSANNPNQACWDGSKYWAVQLNGSTYSIAYSTNLQTWIAAPAQPTNVNVAGGSLYYAGGLLVFVNGGAPGVAGLPMSISSNGAASWTAINVAGVSGAASTAINVSVGATGNSTYPHVVMQQSTSSSAVTYGGISVGTLGGTMTNVVTIATNGATNYSNRTRIIGGYIYVMVPNASNVAMYTAQSSNASLNTAGAWTAVTSSAAAGIALDLAYDPTSNYFVLATSSGIWTTPNSGAAGTPIPPTGTPVWTQRYSTVAMTSVYWTGTQLVAVGLSGHIITSPDGITWTESGGHILASGSSGSNWQGSLYDGTQYVLFSDSTNGVVVSTPDLVTNYVTQYVQESAEIAITASNTSNLPCGLIPANLPNATTGQFVLPTGTYNPCGLVIGPMASNVRTVNLQSMNFVSNGVSGSALLTTTTGISAVPGSYHYYELHYVKVAGTVNSFTCALYIDSVLIATSAAVAIAPTTDTTTPFLICFQRNGVFTAIDDIYVTIDDGIAGTPQGPLGAVNIVVTRPNTDVSDAWVKNGSAASNSLSVNQPAFSSQSANFVSSSNAGDKDVYSSPNVIPSGYTVKAVQQEAVFTRTSSTSPGVNVGIKSGGVESDGTTLTLNNSTPVYANAIYQTNPNGSVAWTPTTAAAVQPVLNHVT